jgi:ADP-ribose pyrophosphatase
MGKENEWSLVGSETEYQNSYFLIERELIEQPNGTRTNYYRINFDSDGGVIALGVRERDIIFIELYRPRLDRRLLELPGGGVKDHETPKEAAKREFAEETGLEPSTAQHLGSFYFSAWTRSQRDIFWVDDFTQVTHENGTEPEVQRVRRIPITEAFDSVCDDSAAEWNLTPLTLAQRKGFIDKL